MNRRYLFSLFVLLIVFHASCKLCSKRGTCPAYDGAFMRTWFPGYDRVDNVYFFIDGDGRVDTLIINDVSKSTSYEMDYSSGLYGRKYFCDHVRGSVISRVDDAHPGWIYFKVYDEEGGVESPDFAERNGSGSEFTLFFKKYQVSLDVFVDGNTTLNFASDSTKYRRVYMNTAVLNGKNYNDVFLINTDDSTTAIEQQIDKMYIGKGIGIIGYRSFPDLKEYWIQ